MTPMPSWLIRETERNDRHVHVSVFVGPDPDHRALVGRLILDHEQALDLQHIFEYGLEQFGGSRARVDFESVPVDGPIRYPSLDDFYDRRERERSPEVDFGVMWTDRGTSWPHYRVSWIEATGEIYAYCLPRGHVEVLGVVQGREAADRALEGWAKISPMTLDWARDRLTS